MAGELEALAHRDEAVEGAEHVLVIAPLDEAGVEALLADQGCSRPTAPMETPLERNFGGVAGRELEGAAGALEDPRIDFMLNKLTFCAGGSGGVLVTVIVGSEDGWLRLLLMGPGTVPVIMTLGALRSLWRWRSMSRRVSVTTPPGTSHYGLWHGKYGGQAGGMSMSLPALLRSELWQA